MWRSRRALKGLDGDIRDHLARDVEEYVARGLTLEEARRQARLKFGNVALVREDARAVWAATVWIEQSGQDARYAFRMLRRHPRFATIVVLMLALGIGMNTAVFSVFNAVMLRPVPYPDADRLLSVSLHGDTPFGAVPSTEFTLWQEQSEASAAFEHLAAYEHSQDHTLQTLERGTQVRNAWVTDGFWSVIGVRPALGDLPTAGDSDGVLLSHAFFERWFGADPGVIGQPVTLNGRQVTMAGVLPDTFRFHFPQEALGPTLRPKAIDVYRPYGASGAPSAAQRRTQGVPVRVVAKMRRNVTVEEARAELDAIRARLAQTRPEPSLDRATLSVLPLHERLVGGNREALWVLLAAVTFVWLIACVNIGNLLLARAAVRQRELAVRASLGAARGRMLRQQLAESLLMALLGGTAGLVLARWALGAIVALIPAETMPRLADASIDVRVLGFALGVSVLTAVLCGLLPVRTLWNVQPQDALREGARTVSAVSGRSQLLVAAELALAVVLLSGTGLMVKSFWRMYAHPPGFDPERTLTMKVMFTADYLNPMRRLAYVDELLRRLQSAPGVELAGISAVGGASSLVDVTVEGTTPRPADTERTADTHLYAASEEFGRAMGFRLVRGRWFTDSEPAPAAVITESVARAAFGDTDPVGRRIHLRRIPALGAPVLSSIHVVGVVSDLQYSKLDARADPQILMSYRHYPGAFPRFTVVARTTSGPLLSAAGIHAQIAGIDKTLPIFDVTTLEDALAESIAPRRFNLLLLGTFATVALMLALIGIYGVMAYTVTQRVREIGVRLALGAERRSVIGLVVRQGMTIALAGIAAGVLGAVALTRLMAGLLYDVAPTDLPTFGAVTAVLAATALLACSGPAIKAARVDPVTALRSE